MGTRPSSGWTPTSLPRLRSSTRSRRRSRVCVTPSSPSCMRTLEVLEVEEFNEKQKEVEGVCNPIITKLYADAGGAPGGMPGGMPDMGGMGGAPGAGAAGGAGGAGPTIEEVD